MSRPEAGRGLTNEPLSSETAHIPHDVTDISSIIHLAWPADGPVLDDSAGQTIYPPKASTP